MNVLEHLAESIATLLREDERRVLLGEDVCDGGMLGLSRIAALDESLRPRLLGTPLTPVGLLAHAAGIGLGGGRPIVLLPSAQSLVDGLAGLREAALLGWRLDVDVPLLFVAPTGPGFGTGADAGEAAEALLCRVPRLRVLTLGVAHEGPALLRAAAEFWSGESPTVLLLPRSLCIAPLDDEPDETLQRPLGTAVPLRHGAQATIFTWGESVPVCAQAIDDSGLDVGLVNIESLSPLPIDALVEALRATGRALIVHAGPRAHGIGAELAAVLADLAILSVDAPLLRVTGASVPLSPEQEARAVPDLQVVRNALDRLVNY